MPRLTKQGKKEEVARLIEQLKAAKAAILAMYRGLSVKEIDALRKQLREQGIVFKVVKTSLLRRAWEDRKLPGLSEETLSQPIALVLSGDDEVTPAKLLFKASQGGKLQMLSGVINAKLVDQAFLNELAQLPGREELLARLVGTLANLPRRLVWSFSYPTFALTNIVRQKAGG